MSNVIAFATETQSKFVHPAITTKSKTTTKENNFQQSHFSTTNGIDTLIKTSQLVIAKTLQLVCHNHNLFNIDD